MNVYNLPRVNKELYKRSFLYKGVFYGMAFLITLRTLRTSKCLSVIINFMYRCLSFLPKYTSFTYMCEISIYWFYCDADLQYMNLYITFIFTLCLFYSCLLYYFVAVFYYVMTGTPVKQPCWEVILYKYVLIE